MMPHTALALALTLAVPGEPAVKRQDGKVWIESVDTYRVMDPLYEGVRIILAARGDVYSPAYLQGISGSAFRIGGICLCAPTCANWLAPRDLLHRLGYDTTEVALPGKGDSLRAATSQAVVRVRAEIDAGRAALVFHALTTAEFDVVFGYDAATGRFLGRGSYVGNDKPYDSAPEDRMGTCGKICPPVGAILIGAKTGSLDRVGAEIAALREAVRHARAEPAPDTDGKWRMLYGIACYDRWAADFRKHPSKMPGGTQYCYGVLRSTHRAAGTFLREIAPRYPSARLALIAAATHFEKEADLLDGAASILGWEAPKVLTIELCENAAGTLEQARDQYAAGIAQIETALASLDQNGQ